MRKIKADRECRILGLGLGAIVLGVALPLAASAGPISYSASSLTVSNIGNNGGTSPYDQVVLTGESGSISGSGTYELADLAFNVGNTGFSIGKFTVPISEALTIGGVTHTLSQSFTDQIWLWDTGQLSASAAVTYTLADGTTVDVTALGTPGLYDFGGIETVAENFTATVIPAGDPPAPLPEPSSLALLGTGLSLLGFFATRRRRRA